MGGLFRFAQVELYLSNHAELAKYEPLPQHATNLPSANFPGRSTCFDIVRSRDALTKMIRNPKTNKTGDA